MGREMTLGSIHPRLLILFDLFDSAGKLPAPYFEIRGARYPGVFITW